MHDNETKAGLLCCVAVMLKGEIGTIISASCRCCKDQPVKCPSSWFVVHPQCARSDYDEDVNGKNQGQSLSFYNGPDTLRGSLRKLTGAGALLCCRSRYRSVLI